MVISTVFDRKSLKEISTTVIDKSPDGPDVISAFVEFIYPAAKNAGVLDARKRGEEATGEAAS